MSVAVLGAGAFGTALAIAVGAKQPVSLWARDPEHARSIALNRENALRLPGCPLAEGIWVTENIQEAASARIILVAVPTQKLRGFLKETGDVLDGKVLVACCKGIELSTGAGPIQIIAETRPESVAALLTGPSFAQDIAKGLPTALTLACADAEHAKDVQAELSTPVLRLYRTTDVIGASLGGALKNVIAIASGAAIGAGLGDSARAALMTRGNAEMQRYAASKGARPETLSGLSGFGDLVLTCTSEQSRNYRLGLAIGKGEDFDPTITVEGAATARALAAEAEETGQEMPIATAVAALVEKRLDVAEAMNALLARSLKEE